MRGHFALPLIAALAAAGSVAAFATTSPANAETCLAAPKMPTPKGAKWFYRLDSKQNKCWHLVWQQAPAVTAKAAPQAAPAKAQAAPPAASAETQQTPARQLVTRDVSDVAPPDALVIPDDAPAAASPAPLPAQATAMAVAEPAQATDAVALPAQQSAPKVAAAVEPEPTGMTQYIFLALVALAMCGGGILYINEIRRRRSSDVLETLERRMPAPRNVPRHEPLPPVDLDNAAQRDDLDEAIGRLVQMRLKRAA